MFDFEAQFCTQVVDITLVDDSGRTPQGASTETESVTDTAIPASVMRVKPGSSDYRALVDALGEAGRREEVGVYKVRFPGVRLLDRQNRIKWTQTGTSVARVLRVIKSGEYFAEMDFSNCYAVHQVM